MHDKENEIDNGISLYLHIPYCISKCAYCDFFSRPASNKLTADQKAIIPDSYITALCNDIAYRINFFKVRKLNSIYIGGGTPSLLSASQFNNLFNKIKSLVHFLENIEITVEVNPDDVSKELLETLWENGVNRISCGIQSMNSDVLKRACRRADGNVNQKAMQLFAEYWKGELSVDLISGLPLDDKDSLINSLNFVCSYNPEHISLYSLTIEENTPFGKQLESGGLVYDFDAADKLWLCGRDFLEEKGWGWYEVSNFCRPGKECIHNLSYWTHKSYLGCGSGATGSFYNKDGSGVRWTGTNDIEKYIDYWTDKKEEELPQLFEEIDIETSEFEFFMMGLRKLSGITAMEFNRVFDKPLPEKFLKTFGDWEKKGLCVRHKVCAPGGGEDERYCMSREGILFLNRFLEEIF